MVSGGATRAERERERRARGARKEARHTIESSRNSKSTSPSEAIINVRLTHISHVSEDDAKQIPHRMTTKMAVSMRRALQRGK